MRTTIQISDDIFRRAKAAAAASGIKLSRLIEDSLRENLRLTHTAEKTRPKRFRMVTWGNGERRAAAPPPDWLKKAWRGAKRRGLDKLTWAEIDEEIAACRREKKRTNRAQSK